MLFAGGQGTTRPNIPDFLSPFFFSKFNCNLIHWRVSPLSRDATQIESGGGAGWWEIRAVPAVVSRVEIKIIKPPTEEKHFISKPLLLKQMDWHWDLPFVYPLPSCQHPPTTGLRSANGRRILATLSNVERNGDYNGDTTESKYPHSKCISDLDAIQFHRVGRGKFFLKIRTDRRILLYLIRIESVDFMASSLAVRPAILFPLFFFPLDWVKSGSKRLREIIIWRMLFYKPSLLCWNSDWYLVNLSFFCAMYFENVGDHGSLHFLVLWSS